MKKKILIGGIIVVALLLLMPSIPAIEQKTIEDKVYSDLVEKLEDVDADFIELLKDFDLEDLREKFEIFVNSEIFKHLSSSDSGQTLLNNNYDFDSKIDSDDLFNPNFIEVIVVLIKGLITWFPMIILVVLIAIPWISHWTVEGFSRFEMYNETYSTIHSLILCLYFGFGFGLTSWLLFFIAVIIWPLFLIWLNFIYNPPGPLQDIVK